MSQTSLLKLSSHRAAGKPERLLRSAVTAFSAIARPTRRETAQLDDLAVPLLGSVSDETLRFAAATLSDSPYAPPTLVRRLCDMSVDICAPLLMRSPVLNGIDLIALIGRHGLPHARAIAARKELDPRIVRLIASLGAFEQDHAPDKADVTRDRLLMMMRSASETTGPVKAPEPRLRWEERPDGYRKLRSTALAGVPTLFQIALADALEITLDTARTLFGGDDMSPLIVALRALDLSEEQAFLICQCAGSSRASDARAVRRFIDAFQSITDAQADAVVAAWRNRPAAARSSHNANEFRASSG